jgi:hypothetical protein
MNKLHDIHERGDLAFPKSLPQFQKLFPDNAACAAYLERVRWPGGFECLHCHEKNEPFRFATRPGVLRCRKCRRDVALTAGTVMQRAHTPLTTWFWGAYLVLTMTPGMSAKQFQRQFGLSHYETAFQILHKLRAGMVWQNRDRIGGNLSRRDHVEIDETYIGGVVHGEGSGPKDQTLVAAAVEVHQQPAKKGDKPMRRGAPYAGRLRLEIVPNRGAKALCGFVEQAVAPGAMVITDAWGGYNSLGARGYEHLPVVESGNPEVAEEFLPIVHLVFSDLKAWLQGTHHGRVSPKHLQAYLNEFTFHFNRRFYPFNAAFRSLLGIGTNGEVASTEELDDLPSPAAQSEVTSDRLAAMEEKYLHATPEVKEKLSRAVERGSIGALVKKETGFKCQLCEALGLDPVGFLKMNGEPYVEAHHVMPVAKKEIGSLSASNIMTLCANHHRQMHYGGIDVVIGSTTFDFVIEEKLVKIPRLAIAT